MSSSKSRIELFLEAMKTGDISNLPIPQSRIEHFLKGIATGDISNLPKPQSRIEEALEYIARNGSSGGGSSDNNYGLKNIEITEKVKNVLLAGSIEEKITIEVVEA